jgi:hypothetical protein
MFYSVMDDTLDLIALAQLRLERAKISSLPNTNREQALNILHGVHPAPPRHSKMHINPVYELCCVCLKQMVTGTPCDSLGTHHAHCEVL